MSRGGDAFLRDFKRVLPDLKLLVDEIDRESYRRDEAAHYTPGLPLAVALPRTTADVVSIARLAHRHRVPIVPRGAGSGLTGAAAGIDGALTVAFTRMDRILQIDTANSLIVVQPGVINAHLKAEAARHKLYYPPDPASYELCTIGGNLGTNAGGLCCVKYGVTRDYVLGLEVVLADGTLIRTGGSNRKDVAGYSLTHLLVGSQGTLGLVTEATLRLRPEPPPKLTLLAFFPTVQMAGRAVTRMAEQGLEPCTVEFMDRVTIAAVDDWHHLGLDRTAGALLLIESDVPGEAGRAELDQAHTSCGAEGASEIVRATDRMEADWLRQVRRLAYRAMERSGVARMEDVGAPRSHLPELLVAIEEIAGDYGVRCGTFGHVGDGNVHPTFVWERGDIKTAARVQDACEALYSATIALGGTITGEHGIGATRRTFLPLQVGEDSVAVMRAIKRALDPRGILNPGRVI